MKYTTPTHIFIELRQFTYDFKQAILSYMAEVEVLEPVSLRDEMKNTTIAMAAKYQNKPQ